MELAVAFGQVLRKMRKQTALTQEQLGFEAGLERNYISMLERGERQPTLTTLVKLARPLNMSAAALVAETEAVANSSNDGTARS